MVDIDLHIQMLSQVPLFSGLNKRQLRAIADRLSTRTYTKDETIIEQGKGGQGLFILVNGKADAIRTQPEGEDVKVNEFKENDFFGELALLDEGLRTASVIATAEVSCLVLTRWDFKALLNSEPEMAVTMLEELAKRFRRALETL